MTDSLLSVKASDSGLHIQLHPLVLLTISDHITRHAARSQQGPILGALLGQQNGREITLEHAFECVVVEGPNGEAQLPNDWFVDRVKQFKDVHKAPALDLMGWWSTAPTNGPTPAHLPIHRQILQSHNESAVFLAFHPSEVEEAASNGGKLPLTVYESVYEGESVTDSAKAMQVDGEEQSLNIRFRQLPYTVETGEAEMIGIDTIARTARNAAAIESVDRAPKKPDSKAQKDGAKPTSDLLSPEEEELIANLTTRLNAIRTLESRISLIKAYVTRVTPPPEGEKYPNRYRNYYILRKISALLSNLSLLTPHEGSEFASEALAQSNDVHLVALLGQLSQSINGMREVGKRTAMVNNVRSTAARKAQLGLGMQGRYEDQLMGGDGIAHG